jgi:hypothetical protein
MSYLTSKFWNSIEQRLITREGSIYFAGGTLCVDTKNSIIFLNLDGTGFIHHTKEYANTKEYFKNGKVYLPDHITDLVRKIYLDVKGETDYYKEKTLSVCIFQ